MESNLDREAAGMRQDELLDTFWRMVAYAAEQDVRVILMAGLRLISPMYGRRQRLV